MKAPLLIAALGLNLAVTGAGRAETPDDARTHADLGGGLSVQAYRITRSNGEFCHLHISIPVVTGSDPQDSRRAARITDTLEDALDPDLPLRLYDAYTSRRECNSEATAYTHDATYHITHAGDDFLSLVARAVDHDGGPHHRDSSRTVSVNTSTGELVKLDAILSPTALPSLIEAMIPKLIAYWDDPATPENEGQEVFDEEWYRLWASELTGLDQIERFTFDRTGLTLYFDPYQISNAWSSPSISFTWQEVERNGWSFPGSVGEQISR
jgi:hypothetical protein